MSFFIKRFGEDKRTAQPGFLEAEIASFFVAEGFSVSIVKRSKKRGDDFEFIARKGATLFNVEVTAVNVPKLSKATIKNRLNDKKDQVPSTAPALLFIILPEAWAEEGDALLGILASATSPVFHLSEAVQCCVLRLGAHIWTPAPLSR